MSSSGRPFHSLKAAFEALREALALDEIPDREDDLGAEGRRLAFDHAEHDVLEDHDLLGAAVRVEVLEEVGLHEEDLPGEGPGIVVALDRLAHPVHVDREGGEVHVGHPVLRGEAAVHDRRRPELARSGLRQARLVAHVRELATFEVEAVGGGVRFDVRVSPRASRDAIGGLHDGALRVKITAPRSTARPNAAIVKLLAKALRVPKRAVRIVSGETSKTKRIEVEGVDAAAVRALA